MTKKIIINKKKLKEKYWIEGLTLDEIAEEYCCARTTIHRWMIVYEIPRRSISEAKNHISKKKSKCEGCGIIFNPKPQQKFCSGICRDKHSRLKHKFNISIKDYNNLLYQQKNRCKICGIHQSKIEDNLCVDHDHKTGKIRGLICHHCNRALGLVKDNPMICFKMIKYLKKQ